MSNVEFTRLRNGLLAIKNDARLIRSLSAQDSDICNLATGIYTGARDLLSEAVPPVEQDPHSGRWYRLDAKGNRKHGPYLTEEEARA